MNKTKFTPVIAKFEYRDDDPSGPVKVYEKEVQFPESPPIAFHALCQFSYHVFWVEKLALRARIEELETELAKARGER